MGLFGYTHTHTHTPNKFPVGGNTKGCFKVLLSLDQERARVKIFLTQNFCLHQVSEHEHVVNVAVKNVRNGKRKPRIARSISVLLIVNGHSGKIGLHALKVVELEKGLG